eukprot:5913803-Amphidinium_carterae.1
MLGPSTGLVPGPEMNSKASFLDCKHTESVTVTVSDNYNRRTTAAVPNCYTHTTMTDLSSSSGTVFNKYRVKRSLLRQCATRMKTKTITDLSTDSYIIRNHENDSPDHAFIHVGNGLGVMIKAYGCLSALNSLVICAST